GAFNSEPRAVRPRMEEVAEMTFQPAQLVLGGTATSAMRISIVPRRGSNQWHGRLFEDFRNTDLNANSWFNNATGLPRNILKLNEFGGNVGGPIWKNKLFVFGTWSQSIQPGANSVTSTVLSPQAQQGVFSYKDTAGAIQSVNLSQVAWAAGLPSTPNPTAADSPAKISSVYGKGALAAPSGPNIYALNFLAPFRINGYYATIRLDANISEKQRVYLSYAQTLTNSPHRNPPQ